MQTLVSPKRSTGFTLIELLIVVAIIGILAAIAVPNFMNAQIRAKVSRAVSDIRSISTALEMYRVDRNAYPFFKGLDYQWASPRIYPALTTPIAYMSSIPKDPFINKKLTDTTSTHEHVDMYPCWNVKEVVASGNVWGGSPLANAVNHGSYMLTLSNGPDQKEDISTNPSTDPEVPILPYNSSNGLTSWGDIYKFTPGMSSY